MNFIWGKITEALFFLPGMVNYLSWHHWMFMGFHWQTSTVPMPWTDSMPGWTNVLILSHISKAENCIHLSMQFIYFRKSTQVVSAFHPMNSLLWKNSGCWCNQKVIQELIFHSGTRFLQINNSCILECCFFSINFFKLYFTIVQDVCKCFH